MKLFEKLALTKKKMGKKGRKAWGGEMSKKGGWKETTKPDRQTVPFHRRTYRKQKS